VVLAHAGADPGSQTLDDRRPVSAGAMGLYEEASIDHLVGHLAALVVNNGKGAGFIFFLI